MKLPGKNTLYRVRTYKERKPSLIPSYFLKKITIIKLEKEGGNSEYKKSLKLQTLRQHVLKTQ